MKKIRNFLIILLLFSIVYVFVLSNKYDTMTLEAQSYGVDYIDCGYIVSLRSIVELHIKNKEASESLYYEALAITNNLVESGANIYDIPLVIYSGVTTSELKYLKEYEENYFKSTKVSSKKPTEEVNPGDLQEDIIDTDSDGIEDSVDICPGFDDTLDSNSNSIPDDCEEVIEEEQRRFNRTEEQEELEPQNPIDIPTIELE